jgi:hypothetical protein
VLLCTEGESEDAEPLAEAVAGCQRILGRRRMKMEALAGRLAAPDPNAT